MRYCIALLAGTLPLWAANYTTSGSGDWNASATWGGAGVPGNGDTATINGGYTVTIPAGYTATIGNSPSPNGVVLTLTAAGAQRTKLVVAGTLHMHGDVTAASFCTIEVQGDGAIESDPGAGTNYEIKLTGASSPYATLKTTATSW